MNSHGQRPRPEIDPWSCTVCGQPLGTTKRIEGGDFCDACLEEDWVIPPEEW